MKSLPTLAKNLAKELPRVDIIGGHIPLSFAENELLKNVLMHTVLNSLDHGIETKDPRKKTGKRSTDRISLSFEICHNQLKPLCDQRRGPYQDGGAIKPLKVGGEPAAKVSFSCNRKIDQKSMRWALQICAA